MKKLPRPAAIALSAEAKRLRTQLIREYGITDPGGRLVLQVGLEAHDRMRAAQAAIAADGAVVKDRWGQLKPHPLLPTERDARAAFLAAIRQLGLDTEPLNAGPGRPSGRGEVDL